MKSADCERVGWFGNFCLGIETHRQASAATVPNERANNTHTYRGEPRTHSLISSLPHDLRRLCEWRSQSELASSGEREFACSCRRPISRLRSCELLLRPTNRIAKVTTTTTTTTTTATAAADRCRRTFPSSMFATELQPKA